MPTELDTGLWHVTIFGRDVNLNWLMPASALLTVALGIQVRFVPMARNNANLLELASLSVVLIVFMVLHGTGTLFLALGAAGAGLLAVLVFALRKLRQQIKQRRIQPLMWQMAGRNARRVTSSVRNLQAATVTSVERTQTQQTVASTNSSKGHIVTEKYGFELLLPREFFVLDETVQGVKEAIELCTNVPCDEQTLYLVQTPGKYHQAALIEGTVPMRKVENDTPLEDLVDNALLKAYTEHGSTPEISITLYLSHEGHQGASDLQSDSFRDSSDAATTTLSNDLMGTCPTRRRARRVTAHVLVVGAAGSFSDMQELDCLYSHQSCDLAANKFAAKLGDGHAWKSLSCLRGVEGGAQPRSFLNLLYNAMQRCDTLREFTVDIHDQDRPLWGAGFLFKRGQWEGMNLSRVYDSYVRIGRVGSGRCMFLRKGGS